MCSRRQVSRQQVAEGECVWAMTQRGRMRQELPLVDFGGLRAAIGAVWGDRLLSGNDGEHAHLEFFHGDVGVMNVDDELTRENSAGRRLGAVVEDDGRRLNAHVHGSRALSLHLGALLDFLFFFRMLVMLVAVEDVHDERLFRL